MSTNLLTETLFSLPSDTEIMFTRAFAAPRERVWAAWTECEHLAHWWGPQGWGLTHCKIDLRPQGRWTYTMRGEMHGETLESHGLAIYEAVVVPEKLEYKDYFTDASFEPMPGMPAAQITLLFEEGEGQTTVTSTTRYDSRASRDQVVEMGVEAGMRQTIDRLVELLAKQA